MIYDILYRKKDFRHVKDYIPECRLLRTRNKPKQENAGCWKTLLGQQGGNHLVVKWNINPIKFN